MVNYEYRRVGEDLPAEDRACLQCVLPDCMEGGGRCLRVLVEKAERSAKKLTRDRAVIEQAKNDALMSLNASNDSPVMGRVAPVARHQEAAIGPVSSGFKFWIVS